MIKSKYYSFSLIILAYAALALVAKTLLQLEIAAMRSGVSIFLESNIFLMIAPSMALVGYAAVKTLKLAE
ncbi:hypothetical protein [Methanococcoides vulcani]|uniref:hypothetical protein n=1 Tax=Methanococcoides vulcani TaxID=1353158 RepID=UPI0010834BA3|nr:hypothetical protein [Methanococcoides vulcani]